MNWFFIASGIVASLTFLIHVVLGNKDVLGPTLMAPFDEVARRTMHGAWHLVTVTLFLSAVALFASALDAYGTQAEANLVARLVAVLYLAFTGVFAWVAIISRLPKAFLKLPQWTLFIPIAGLALAGSF